MNCEQISELLSPYIDQMTNAKENKAIIAHLAVCQNCREELKELESLAAMMHELYTPQLPDTFAQDLRQRLNDEKVSILKPMELKRPSKAGWIAAAVAIVALGTGIFSSSFVPIDNIIAYRQNQTENNEFKKPSMSVEEILSHIKIWDKDTNNDNTADIAQTNTGNEEPIKEPVEPTDNIPVANEPVIETDPDPGIRIADIFSAQIKVDNTEEAVDQIIQIAQANNAEYDLNATSSIVQAFSAGSTQMVELKVSHDRVDSLIKEIDSMGMIAAPMHDETVLTDDYADAQEQIKVINEKIAEAKKIDDQLQLKQLNKDLYEWTSRKTVIDEEINLATVRVYLVEEINP